MPDEGGLLQNALTENMNPLYWFFKTLYWAFGKAFFTLRVEGEEHLICHGEGGTILACNHQSFLDPPFVAVAYPGQIHFLARDTLFNGAFGKVIAAINAVPINRDGADLKSLKTIINTVKSGKRVLMFPEGTRSEDGALQEAAGGIGMIVAKSQAIVQPIRIDGAYEAWSRHMKLPKPAKVTVKIGPPIDFSHLGKIRSKEQYQEVADTIMEKIGEL